MNPPSAPGVTPTQRRLIEEALAADANQMTLVLARRLGVPEVEVVRALPDGRAVELDVGRWEELLRAFAAVGDVHVLVSNASVTCEVVGRFGGFSTWGGFFNVQSASLDLHIRFEQLASAFAVEKPSHISGVNTLSVQFFDQAGASALKVFLTFGGKASAGQAEHFQRLREEFRR